MGIIPKVRNLDCLIDSDDIASAGISDGRPLPIIHAIGMDDLPARRATLSPAVAAWLDQTGFTAAAGELALLPGPHGIDAAWVGLGTLKNSQGHFTAFGDLPNKLPAGSIWAIADDLTGPERQSALLAFCLGAYRFTEYRAAKRPPARLRLPKDADQRSIELARAIWFARDLINRPANDLGPAELADAVRALGDHHHASVTIISGATLERDYPTVALVGNGADRAPCVAALDWTGPDASADAPLIALCGKGVVFDTGGNDIKPAGAMLRMKKDMAGAAILMGVAHAVMAAGLPIRLALRVGCVENAVSGRAMRPLDIVRTRSGRTVEIGNTDAEGRLVLCDLIDEVAALNPAVIIDAATLTGAARVALGPDLPALFCNNEEWAARMLAAGSHSGDPVWRLPLWQPYDSWLDSPVAEMNNVSSKPFAGAIVAALYLQRYVPGEIPWVHLDTFGWNDQSRPGRPEGADTQGLRCITAALCEHFR